MPHEGISLIQRLAKVAATYVRASVFVGLTPRVFGDGGMEGRLSPALVFTRCE